MLAMPDDVILEARDHVGPTTILRGSTAKDHTRLAASVTLKYSDAPDAEGAVTIWRGEDSEHIMVKPAVEDDYIRLRI